MFCLPLTEDQFNKDNENLKKDFVREQLPIDKPEENRQKRLWEVYLQEVVRPYQNLKKQFSVYGFVFNESVTFSMFAELIQNYEVNILFSHCKTGTNEEIEFFDRLVPKDEFIDAIPLNYNKIIDLSVCMPENTAKDLKHKRRNAIVKSVDKPIDFLLWLYIYGLTFEIISDQQAPSFPEAFELTFNKLYSL